MEEKKPYVLDINATPAQLKHVLSHLKIIKIEVHVREVEEE